MKQKSRDQKKPKIGKKLFAIAVSLCLLATGSPLTAGVAFAGEADTAEVKNIGTENKCGYKPVQGIPKEAVQQDSMLTGKDTEDMQKVGKAESSLRTLYSAGTADGSEQNSDASEDGDDGVTRYGYNYLVEKMREESEEGKENIERILALYESIRDGIGTLTWDINTTIKGDGATEYPTLEEVKTAFSLVKDDYPEYFWAGENFYFTYENDDKEEQDEYAISSLEPMYLFADDDEEFETAYTEFNESIEKILAELNEELDGSDSNYDKELWLHDYLIKTNDYLSYSEGVHTAYGAIVEGEAVCEGYARAFQLLMNKIGIENCTITGSDDLSSTTENHIWNAVKLDGSWYQVDVTWDDMGNDDEGTYHAYFNLSSKEMGRDHKVINYCEIPECTADTYFYFNQNGNNENVFTATTANADSDRFASNIAGQIKSKGYAAIYCPEDIGTQKTIGEFFKQNNSSIAKKLGLTRWVHEYSYVGYKEYHFLVYDQTEWQDCANFYGQLVLGIPDLDGVRIRLYASDKILGVTDDTRSNTIWDAVEKHRKDDNLHLATAVKSKTDPEDDWWSDGGKGCEFTHFEFDSVPVGEYNLAVYKENYGLWIYGITIGKDGATPEAEDDSSWWCIYTLGDLDDNLWVDGSDALFMQRYIAKWESYVKTGNWYAADINNDGKVDPADLTILQRHLAGWSDFKDLEEYERGDKTLENTENAA